MSDMIEGYAKRVREERQSKWDPLMETHNPDKNGVPNDVDKDWWGVASDAIHSIYYDGTDLHVKFHSGHKYRYKDVEKSVYDALRCAPSVGRAFYDLITNNGVAYEQEA